MIDEKNIYDGDPCNRRSCQRNLNRAYEEVRLITNRTSAELSDCWDKISLTKGQFWAVVNHFRLDQSEVRKVIDNYKKTHRYEVDSVL